MLVVAFPPHFTGRTKVNPLLTGVSSITSSTVVRCANQGFFLLLQPLLPMKQERPSARSPCATSFAGVNFSSDSITASSSFTSATCPMHRRHSDAYPWMCHVCSMCCRCTEHCCLHTL
uniref:Uncharacterized protein n=1 Tax=Arundo donax TaxID=35708 RepID=A0A0A8YTC4_ARUDO